MKLDGKVALVTGSSQGIGQGIILRLTEAGAMVVINSAHIQKAHRKRWPK
jgi:glucose 1-dehydrogenase